MQTVVSSSPCWSSVRSRNQPKRRIGATPSSPQSSYGSTDVASASSGGSSFGVHAAARPTADAGSPVRFPAGVSEPLAVTVPLPVLVVELKRPSSLNATQHAAVWVLATGPSIAATPVRPRCSCSTNSFPLRRQRRLKQASGRCGQWRNRMASARSTQSLWPCRPCRLRRHGTYRSDRSPSPSRPVVGRSA